MQRPPEVILREVVVWRTPVSGANDGMHSAGAHIVDCAADRDVLRNERRVAQEGNIVAHALFKIGEWQKILSAHAFDLFCQDYT